ncbi:MAG: porin family protein [Rhizobiales bacterium]|nr:porin family protein [Hyphomicrobiales bacterium]
MKNTLMAAAALLIAGTTASFAADLAFKAPHVAPNWSWNGFYIGGNVGAGWGTTESSLNSIAVVGVGAIPFGFPIAQNSRSGFLGGAQIGYNYQVGAAVLGLQADIAGLDVKGTTPCIIALSCTAKSDWLATVSGRLGGVVADKTLIYAKGGAAWMNTTHSVTIPVAGLGGGLGALGGSTTSSTENTALGWLIGFGAEYAFAPNWTAFIEYNYMEFGTKSSALDLTALAGGLGGAGTATANVDFKNKLSIAKIGVNYKF